MRIMSALKFGPRFHHNIPGQNQSIKAVNPNATNWTDSRDMITKSGPSGFFLKLKNIKKYLKIN
jgi:hypothetical protein